MNWSFSVFTGAMLIGLTSIPADTARAQSAISVDDVTSGACMVICDDMGFCEGMDYDPRSGKCMIFINATSPAYRQLQTACPGVPPSGFVIGYSGDRWRVNCPSGSAGPAAPSANGMFDGDLGGVD